MKNICIYYFTGSGNTLKIAKHLQKNFIKKDFSCILKNMEKVLVEDNTVYEYIGLLFPVAIQSTFPLVWKFIHQLPTVKGQKIFMVDTMESFSGGVVGPLKKILTLKGYNCVGAIELKMSSSIEFRQKNFDKRTNKNKVALESATIFIEDLLKGNTKWQRVAILSDCMKAISKPRGIWTKQSKSITIDHEACVMCGLCTNNCPVQAISDSSGYIIIDHKVCQSCMRCVNYCPKEAFSLYNKKVYQNKGVKVNEFNHL